MGDGKKWDPWELFYNSGKFAFDDYPKFALIESEARRPGKNTSPCDIEQFALEACRMHNMDRSFGPHGYTCQKEISDMFECMEKLQRTKLQKNLLHVSTLENDPIHSMQGFRWRY